MVPVIALGVLLFAILLCAAWGVLCALAWAEDEIFRFVKAKKRKARMRARAAENCTRMDGKKPPVREVRR